jgi:hypothetical protein
VTIIIVYVIVPVTVLCISIYNLVFVRNNPAIVWATWALTTALTTIIHGLDMAGVVARFVLAALRNPDQLIIDK